MSQIYVPLTTTNPAIPTDFETQDGGAVPLANTLIIDAFDSGENNDNGIVTKGGVAAGDPPGTGAANEVSIYITNRLTGVLTDATDDVKTIITLPLGTTAACYLIYGNIQAYSAGLTAGSAYTFEAAYRTNGVAATEISGEFAGIFEDASLLASDVRLEPSGNNAILTVQGIDGVSINWNALLEYRMVT